MPLVDLIAGARPNFMKIAPIIRAIEVHNTTGGRLDYRLVHTGQHYDQSMSADFFRQLDLPAPDVNLEVRSGPWEQQAGEIVNRYSDLLRQKPPDLCLVVGDVTSTVSAAIAARHGGIPVAHVEAGIRSGDWTMPEEMNRVVTDQISDWFYTTSEHASQNLRGEGVDVRRIVFVGNTMIDTLLANIDRLTPPAFWDGAGLEPNRYLVMTLHRPSNVDDPSNLRALVHTIAEAARGEKVIFPVHPRTARTLCTLGDLPENILAVEPQPYLEFNFLVRHARAVITDSGGITEETTVMGIPCMTLRDTTERPETVLIGTNEILGTDSSAIRPALDRLLAGEWKRGAIPELWDGKAGPRIVEHLSQLLAG